MRARDRERPDPPDDPLRDARPRLRPRTSRRTRHATSRSPSRCRTRSGSAGRTRASRSAPSTASSPVSVLERAEPRPPLNSATTALPRAPLPRNRIRRGSRSVARREPPVGERHELLVFGVVAGGVRPRDREGALARDHPQRRRPRDRCSGRTRCSATTPLGPGSAPGPRSAPTGTTCPRGTPPRRCRRRRGRTSSAYRSSASCGTRNPSPGSGQRVALQQTVTGPASRRSPSRSASTSNDAAVLAGVRPRRSRRRSRSWSGAGGIDASGSSSPASAARTHANARAHEPPEPFAVAVLQHDAPEPVGRRDREQRRVADHPSGVRDPRDPVERLRTTGRTRRSRLRRRTPAARSRRRSSPRSASAARRDRARRPGRGTAARRRSCRRTLEMIEPSAVLLMIRCAGTSGCRNCTGRSVNSGS